MSLHIVLGEYFMRQEQEQPWAPEAWAELFVLMDWILNPDIEFKDPMSLEALFREYTLRKRDGQMMSPDKLDRFLELLLGAIQDAKIRSKAILSQLLGEYYMTIAQGHPFDPMKQVQLVELINLALPKSKGEESNGKDNESIDDSSFEPVAGLGPDHYIYADGSRDSSFVTFRFRPVRTTIYDPQVLEHIRKHVNPELISSNTDVPPNKRPPPNDPLEKSPKKRRV